MSQTPSAVQVADRRSPPVQLADRRSPAAHRASPETAGRRAALVAVLIAIVLVSAAALASGAKLDWQLTSPAVVELPFDTGAR